MNEQKIREAFAKEVWADTVWEGCGPTALDIYTAGYLALLNELEAAAKLCDELAANGVFYKDYAEHAFAGDCAAAIREMAKEMK